MFTLIYDQGQLNKPNNIVSFLECQNRSNRINTEC